MASRSMLEKPHAVCIPFPAQGHINPMLKLAKLLHYKGFHITFVNTEFNHKRLLKSQGPDSLNGLPSFRFETIPDGLQESDSEATQDIPSLCESTSKHCLAPFKDLISKLNDNVGLNVPPVTCIVSDSSMFFTFTAAEELGIPHVFLWTASACSFMGYLQYCNLIDKGIIPLKGTLGRGDEDQNSKPTTTKLITRNPNDGWFGIDGWGGHHRLGSIPTQICFFVQI